MKSFPKPLSAKDEKVYLQRWKEGDREARSVLIERNLRLVAYIVKKYTAAIGNVDDLISIGTIGLIKAVDSFDVDKGIRLATYASRCIDNELLMMLRSDKKQSKEVYLYEPIGSDKEGNEINLLDIIESVDEDIAEKMELKDNIGKLYGYVDQILTPREKQIINMRYGLTGQKEVTQREIADNMGISRSYVSRIEKKALKKLRDCYESEERKASHKSQ